MTKKNLTKKDIHKIQLLLCNLQDITMYNVQSLNYLINNNFESIILEDKLYDFFSTILSNINKIMLFFDKEDNNE